MRDLRLEGQNVYLAEVEEQYFPYIIAWRNDPLNNRYLNQPFLLDMEKQRAWYERYLSDSAQGLLVVVDKQMDTPFATMGWTDHDIEERVCITGRLLVSLRTICTGHLVLTPAMRILYVKICPPFAIMRSMGFVGMMAHRAIHMSLLPTICDRRSMCARRKTGTLCVLL